MTADRSEALAAFLREKEQLKKELAAAISAKLEDMGPEIRGLSWFPSSSKKYWEQQFKVAA